MNPIRLWLQVILVALLCVFVSWLIFLAGENIVVHAQTVPFQTNLYYGVNDAPDVEQLQEFLTTEGYYNYQITGNFYFITLKAVKAFQEANNLPTSGYFGVLSRGVANDVFAAENTISPSSELGTSTVWNGESTTTVNQSQATSPVQEEPVQEITQTIMPEQAPQFIGEPVASSTPDGSDRSVTLSWQTDSPATAELYFMVGPGNQTAVLQQSWTENTSFTYQHILGNESYNCQIVVSANGMSTTKEGTL